jgi:hypothetical protein
MEIDGICETLVFFFAVLTQLFGRRRFRIFLVDTKSDFRRVASEY